MPYLRSPDRLHPVWSLTSGRQACRSSRGGGAGKLRVRAASRKNGVQGARGPVTLTVSVVLGPVWGPLP